MIVADASVVVSAMHEDATTPFTTALLSGQQVHAPELVDLEVAQALRRAVRGRRLERDRARIMLDDLIDSPIERWPHTPLLEGAWALRDQLTTYDAVYLVLADILHAPLATLDATLATVASKQGVEVIVPG